MFLSKRRLSTLLLVSSALAIYACADNVDMGNVKDGGDAGPPDFTPPPQDGGDAALDRPQALMCMGTECPAPYETCADKPSFKCGTNLLNDPNNCGACGVSCLGFDPINMSASCAQGKCAFECLIKNIGNETAVFKNCNGLLDDGCEVNVRNDPANCGVCGHACNAGERCINGFCGCQGGKVDCGGYCTDTRYDDINCGACGVYCEDPPDACTTKPANTIYGCARSKCGALKCLSDWMDCNNDLAQGCSSDGCETPQDDINNCGGCGIKCGPGQECRNDGAGLQCLDTCEKAGLSECPSGCKDLLADPYNCGGCGTSCGNPGPNQAQSECRKGVCERECLPGFADCNGDPNDGCEIDLRSHPANCGACGKKCDFGAGQPCIDGTCLMVECDGGVLPK